jgi:hypothetical protein
MHGVRLVPLYPRKRRIACISRVTEGEPATRRRVDVPRAFDVIPSLSPAARTLYDVTYRLSFRAERSGVEESALLPRAETPANFLFSEAGGSAPAFHAHNLQVRAPDPSAD